MKLEQSKLLKYHETAGLRESHNHKVVNLLLELVLERPNISSRDYATARDYRRDVYVARRDLNLAKSELYLLACRVSDLGEIYFPPINELLPSRIVVDLAARKIDYRVGQYFATEYRAAVVDAARCIRSRIESAIDSSKTLCLRVPRDGW